MNSTARDRRRRSLGANTIRRFVSIAKEVRERTALEAAQVSAQATLSARQDAVREAEEADRLAREASIKARSEADGPKSAHELSVGRRGKAQAVYRERLDANNFTDEDCQSHKMRITTIDADTEAVEEYGRKLDHACRSKEKAEKAISGSERPRFGASGNQPSGG